MKMTEFKQHSPNQEDLLADFTDRVLDGNSSLSASSADDELRGLEETILRLEKALPREAPSEATLKRLQADFRSRTKSAERSSRSSWQSRQSRQRWTMTFIAVSVLAAIFIAIPFSLSDGGNVQGTAGLQPQNITLVLIAGGCIIALLIWLGRRK